MKRILVLALMLACSRSTDQSSVKTLQIDETKHETAEVKGGGETTEEHGPTTVVEVGSWDELVFADEPDAGTPAAAAGPGVGRATPQVARLLHVLRHPSVKITTDAPWSRDAKFWTEGTSGAEEDTGLTANDDEKRKTDTRLGPPWWVWLLGGLLAAGALAALYRFRKVIPWLRFIP